MNTESIKTKTYFSQEEFNFLVSVEGLEAVKQYAFYIGNYSSYGQYLNLLVYSERDKEEFDLKKEMGI